MFIKKKKLDEVQINKFGILGSRLGDKLVKSRTLKKAYIATSRFGNRYPAVIVGVAMLLAILSTGLSLFRVVQSPSRPQITEGLLPSSLPINSPYDDSIHMVKQGIEEEITKANAISDSIQTLLKKPTLSREDSLYIITQGEYLKSVTNIIQTKE